MQFGLACCAIEMMSVARSRATTWRASAPRSFACSAAARADMMIVVRHGDREDGANGARGLYEQMAGAQVGAGHGFLRHVRRPLQAPTPSPRVWTASSLSTFTSPAARRVPRRCSTASCSCSARSTACRPPISPDPRSWRSARRWSARPERNERQHQGPPRPKRRGATRRATRLRSPSRLPRAPRTTGRGEESSRPTEDEGRCQGQSGRGREGQGRGGRQEAKAAEEAAEAAKDPWERDPVVAGLVRGRRPTTWSSPCAPGTRPRSTRPAGWPAI